MYVSAGTLEQKKQSVPAALSPNTMNFLLNRLSVLGETTAEKRCLAALDNTIKLQLEASSDL